MTTEIQPRERLPFYIPENWLPLDTGSASGSYINYPTAQTANISFPGAILCSNLESFAPSAPMNLFNNSTTGDIQIANTFGYTGGIVMSADGTTPVDGKIIIGDSARPLLAPLIETDIIQGSITSQVEVASDLLVQDGYTVFTNDIEKASGKVINIGTTALDITINIGSSIVDDPINIGAGMSGLGSINLGGLLGITNAANFESGLISCKGNNALSIGTFVGRTSAIDIGTGMTSAGNINLGGANGTTNAQKLESGFIACAGNTPLSIGTFAGRTRDINIGTGMNLGNILLGGALTTVKTNMIQSNTTLELQQSDNMGTGTIQISNGITRLGNISIGVNTSAIAGETPGNVNIMNGAGGRQEGSFNVLTDSNNRGNINLGNTSYGGINIFGDLLVGLRLGYVPTTYNGNDTFLGGYKSETYNNTGSMSLNTTQQRIVGSISTIMSVGLYQVNINTTLKTSVVNPYLTLTVYTKTGTPAWTNGALRGATGSSVPALSITKVSTTTAVANKFTLSLSGLLTVSTKVYVAVVVEEADTTLSQDITSTDTYISLLRVG